MKTQSLVKATLSTSDGKKTVDIDAADWIKECGGDSFLLDHWDSGFRNLGREFDWMDYDDDPGVTEILEHCWAAEDRGENVDVVCIIRAEDVMPFIKQHMPKHYDWMSDWIKKFDGDPMVLPKEG